MTPRQIALLQRKLFEKCGGVPEAAKACGLSAPQLYRCQDPQSESNLSVDRLAVLEAYCGDPIVSRALFEAAPAPSAVRSIMDEAMQAAEAAMDLQREARLAVADGDLTPREREVLRARVVETKQQLTEVEAALDQGAV